MNEQGAQQLLDMLKRHLAFYQEYLVFLQSKLAIMANNQLEELDAFVKEEEVFFLRAKGIERERMQVQEELGAQDQAFRDLIPSFPEELQTEGQTVFRAFSDTLLDIKATNLQCKSMAELRLHRIQTAIHTLEQSRSTGKDNKTVPESKGFVSKKI